jgi:hypothetical protein
MAGEAQAFTCPNCGGSVQVRAVGRSLAVVCPQCLTVIDPNDANHKILSKAKSNTKYEPIIPLGTRGKIRDTVFEVIGFMIRCDKSGMYQWEEYLLYNPLKGYFWLVQNDGSWSFVAMLKQAPIFNGSGMGVNYDKRDYRIYISDQAKVVYVVGEFYWQVRVGETTQAVDYVAPPFMLSQERSADETVWSRGEYVNPWDIDTAFSSVKLDMPLKKGVAPNEPNPYNASLLLYIAIGLIASVLCVIAGSSPTPGTGNNIVTGLLLILAVPAWRIYRDASFERERWSNSDFAPADSSSSSSDDE